jgi:hypothetical protein
MNNRYAQAVPPHHTVYERRKAAVAGVKPKADVPRSTGENHLVRSAQQPTALR